MLAIWFMLTVVSCQPQQERKVLKPEEMTAILIDLHIMEGRLEQQKVAKDTLAFMMKANYALLFKRHNITEEYYKQSMNYYLKQPKLLEPIYEGVVDSLSTLEAELKSRPAEIDD